MMDLGLKKLDRYIMKKFMSTFFIALILGTLCLLCYDEPLRRWLSRKDGK